VIVSDAARQTLAHECAMKLDELHALADVGYPNAQIGAAPASGSFKSLGMIIAPCSIRSMSEIATGVTSTLLTRAADVTLKERRRLVLLVRETPLHSGHLRTMLELSTLGAVIAPPVPAFYAKPQSVADIVANTVGRALDLFGLDSPDALRWGEGTRQPQL
jgi:4-hydroxy-3-polyprenylbenzoate decarboxylase